jgi:hypothetical protein
MIDGSVSCVGEVVGAFGRLVDRAAQGHRFVTAEIVHDDNVRPEGPAPDRAQCAKSLGRLWCHSSQFHRWGPVTYPWAPTGPHGRQRGRARLDRCVASIATHAASTVTGQASPGVADRLKIAAVAPISVRRQGGPSDCGLGRVTPFDSGFEPRDVPATTNA